MTVAKKDLTVVVSLIDPFYSATALHFDNLFERYGSPVYVLNLVKVYISAHCRGLSMLTSVGSRKDS